MTHPNVSTQSTGRDYGIFRTDIEPVAVLSVDEDTLDAICVYLACMASPHEDYLVDLDNSLSSFAGALVSIRGGIVTIVDETGETLRGDIRDYTEIRVYRVQ